MSPCYWTHPALPHKEQFLIGVHQETNLLFEPKTFFLGYHFNILPAAGIQGFFFKSLCSCSSMGHPLDKVQKDNYSLLMLSSFQTAVENVSPNSQWLVIEHFSFHGPPSLSLCIYVYQSSSSWFGNNQKQT